MAGVGPGLLIPHLDLVGRRKAAHLFRITCIIISCLASMLLLLQGQQADEIDRWIERLAAKDVGAREEAEAALRKCIERAVPALRRVARKVPDAEAQPRDQGS